VLGKGLGGVEGMPGKGLSGGPENRRGLTAGGIAAIGGAGAVVGGIIGTLIFPGIGTVVGAAVGSVVGGGAAVVDYTRPASADMVGHQPVEDIQDVPPDIEV
jgi:hypothetical protein